MYFITQNPADVPEDILGQLGNRVQHALRAFTARDKKALRLAAETYCENPAFDIEQAITEVGVGEAVTSFLEGKGVPGVAERTLIRAPSSQLGSISVSERATCIANSAIAGKYETLIDRHLAFETLTKRAERAADAALAAEQKEEELQVAEREYLSNRRDSGTKVGRSTARASRRSSTSLGAEIGKVVLKELKGTTGRRYCTRYFGWAISGALDCPLIFASLRSADFAYLQLCQTVCFTVRDFKPETVE